MKSSVRWVSVAVLMTAVGCKEKKNVNGDPTSVIARVNKEKLAARAPVLGRRVLEGLAQDLRASPDGHVLTALQNAQKPSVEGVPPPMRLGELWAVNVSGAEGGTGVKLGAGVTNMPGGWLITADSRWILYSASWEPRTQAGELHVQDASNLANAPQRLASRVTYFVPSDDGQQLAYIEGGVLHVGALPGGPFPQVAGEVSTAEFSADGRYLYFKRRFSAAGGLYQVDLRAQRPEPRRLADQVTDYTVLRSGKHVVAMARETPSAREMQLHLFDVQTLTDRKLSDDAHRYRISRDGAFIAWRDANPAPDKGTLNLMAIADGKPTVLGANVNDFDFSPDGKRFIYRDNYRELALGGADATREDVRLVERVGDLYGVEMPSGKPTLLVRQCPNFSFAPGGHALAFTARIDKPEVTRRLYLYPEGAASPFALRDWLYEYQFPGAGERLYFRSDCLREGRACELNSIAANAPDASSLKKETESVFGFRFNAEGTAAAVALPHLTDQTFDVAWHDFRAGTHTIVDQYVEWPALVIGSNSVAYLVNEKQRPGIYVATSL